MSYKTITKCRCCDGTNLAEYLDLTDQPLANSYHDGTTALPIFPLKVNVCVNCWHSQLSVVVDPDLMFKSYPYVTGTSKTMLEYCDLFAREITKFCEPRETAPRILDIAC